MPNLNRCEIIGNVGKDPEMRFTAMGTPVCGFSVAVNSFYTTADGEKKQDTEWFTVTAWGKLAENVNQYVAKGMPVFVEGRLKTRSWDQDGIKRYRTELVAYRVLFLGAKKETLEEVAPVDEVFGEPGEPEDLPF